MSRLKLSGISSADNAEEAISAMKIPVKCFTNWFPNGELGHSPITSSHLRSIDGLYLRQKRCRQSGHSIRRG